MDLELIQDLVVMQHFTRMEVLAQLANCSSGTKIDSYRITDVSLSKQINERVDVYMIVENIFNEEDVVARAPKNGARAQKPRTTLFRF